jgi:multicomponent Na+:H+ antiporter subunit F
METSSVLEAATVLGMLLLVAAMLLAGIRIVRGPHVADRIVALDMLSLIGVAAAALAAVVSGSTAFVDVAVGVALVGFLATVAFAAFIERGSLRGEDRP